mmetsp:Transcript_51491/g.122589  ORF Transcript_51491/g.122589 Transcript_51491/m.122589 type:complete len:210 (-) Transcript_51491:35-664(-)
MGGGCADIAGARHDERDERRPGGYGRAALEGAQVLACSRRVRGLDVGGKHLPDAFWASEGAAPRVQGVDQDWECAHADHYRNRQAGQRLAVLRISRDDRLPRRRGPRLEQLRTKLVQRAIRPPLRRHSRRAAGVRRHRHLTRGAVLRLGRLPVCDHHRRAVARRDALLYLGRNGPRRTARQRTSSRGWCREDVPTAGLVQAQGPLVRHF